MSKTLKIAVPLTEELGQAIADLSATSGLSLRHIAEDALKQYVSWRAAQLQDLQEAIAAADRGEFATDEEVKALFTRHGA